MNLSDFLPTFRISILTLEIKSYRTIPNTDFSSSTIQLIPEPFDVVECIADDNRFFRHCSDYGREECRPSWLFSQGIYGIVYPNEYKSRATIRKTETNRHIRPWLSPGSHHSPLLTSNLSESHLISIVFEGRRRVHLIAWFCHSMESLKLSLEPCVDILDW
jgi:hypothetical protein